MRSFLATICGIVLVVGHLAGLALHIFTCYIAYQVGFIPTALTFFFPFLSEVYWFFALWSANGFLNVYTVACLVVVALYMVGYGGMMLAGEEKAPEPLEQSPTDEFLSETDSSR